jgi:hypothetical protein
MNILARVWILNESMYGKITKIFHLSKKQEKLFNLNHCQRNCHAGL